MSDVTFSVFKMMFSPAREQVFFKIGVLMPTRAHFPILMIFASSKWCSRLGESTISMFECGDIVLIMRFSPARGHTHIRRPLKNMGKFTPAQVFQRMSDMDVLSELASRSLPLNGHKWSHRVCLFDALFPDMAIMPPTPAADTKPDTPAASAEPSAEPSFFPTYRGASEPSAEPSAGDPKPDTPAASSEPSAERVPDDAKPEDPAASAEPSSERKPQDAELDIKSVWGSPKNKRAAEGMPAGKEQHSKAQPGKAWARVDTCWVCGDSKIVEGKSHHGRLCGFCWAKVVHFGRRYKGDDYNWRPGRRRRLRTSSSAPSARGPPISRRPSEIAQRWSFPRFREHGAAAKLGASRDKPLQLGDQGLFASRPNTRASRDIELSGVSKDKPFQVGDRGLFASRPNTRASRDSESQRPDPFHTRFISVSYPVSYPRPSYPRLGLRSFRLEPMTKRKLPQLGVREGRRTRFSLRACLEELRYGGPEALGTRRRLHGPIAEGGANGFAGGIACGLPGDARSE